MILTKSAKKVLSNRSILNKIKILVVTPIPVEIRPDPNRQCARGSIRRMDKAAKFPNLVLHADSVALNRNAQTSDPRVPISALNF